MRRRPLLPAARVLVTLAALVPLGACATKGDMRDLQMELRTLAARQDTLLTRIRLESRSTQDTLRQTSDQLFNLRGDIASQLQAIARSLSTLEAMVGENQRGMARMADQLANMRRAPLTSTQGGPLGGGGPADGVTGGGGGAEETYNAAMAEYQRGSLATARTAFGMLLQNYPTDTRAADARFYLADILEQEGDTQDALAAFQEIGSLYPTHTRVPDAMYRSALLEIELGRRDQARATLQRIVATYPDTITATLARDRLAELR